MSEQERAAALKTCRVAGLMTAPEQPIARLAAVGAVDWGECVPVLLKLTSGTTAAPRAIRFRSAQLLADAVQICDTMGITAADLNFAVIPVSHSYGFSNLLTPLLVRGVPLALSRDRMPRAVLDALARTESTVFPGMPLFFQAFGEMPETPRLPKSAFVHFRGRAAELCCRAQVSGEFWPGNSFVLRRLGVRRNLL